MKIRCLVLTPVGPRANVAHVEDTVESFRHYMSPAEAVMLVLDDSGTDVLSERLAGADNVICLPVKDVFPYSGQTRNTYGCLFAKQIAALDLVTREYDWQCLMRLDDDALILGPNPHEEALDVFKRRRDIGMLGAYLRRGDGTEKRAAMAQKGREIISQLVSRDAVRHPAMGWLLLRLVVAAKRNGYRLGDMCTGGSFFLTRRTYDGFTRFWRGGGMSLRFSYLADDLLFALHTAAAGFRISDFPGGSDIMAVNWRGLPMSPEDLVRRGKKVVHPVKDLEDPSAERKVREFFRARRIAERHGPGTSGN